MTIVLGVDLSLTSTGLATASWTGTVKGRGTGYDRLRQVRGAILQAAEREQPALVVVEGPSFGSVGRGQHERGGLWWMACEALDAAGYAIAVAPPPNVKKFATGSGNADKDQMILAAARGFAWFAGNNDQADALWLCALGHEFLGDPLLEMPAKNRQALLGVAWPAVATA